MIIKNTNKNNRMGAVLPLVALMLPVLMLLGGFAINVAYMQLTATELQISTDAAARAAGRVFAKTNNQEEALQIANTVGALNEVAGEGLQFTLSDLDFGESTRANANSRYEFRSGGAINSVQVIGRRTSGSASGTVSTFFPSLMNRADFELSASSISTQIEIDLVLVLDRSGSMAYADNEEAVFPPIPVEAPVGWDFGDPAPPNSRWLDAVAATEELLLSLEESPLDQKLGLVTYGNFGSRDVLLTSDYSQITERLDRRTQRLVGGATNIASGLNKAFEVLTSAEARPFAGKVALVMTDGHRTAGGDPVTVARRLAEEGILVITVTFSQEADRELMERIAEEGNGFHRHADFSEDLVEVFAEISRELPSLLTQ